MSLQDYPEDEFVFTADAVRNAGGGDVDKGAEVMYNMMKNLLKPEVTYLKNHARLTRRTYECFKHHKD